MNPQSWSLRRTTIGIACVIAPLLAACTTLQVVESVPPDAASLPDVAEGVTTVPDVAASLPEASTPDRMSGSQDAGAADVIVDAGREASSAPPEAGIDCGTAPPIFTNAAAGPFCPFTSAGFVSCAQGQHCCEYAADAGMPSTCNAGPCASPAILSGADWQCDEENDCPQNEVCCLVGSAAKSSTCPTRFFGVAVSGSMCRTTCGAGERVVCGSQADCTTGTCAQFSARGKSLGFCRP